MGTDGTACRERYGIVIWAAWEIQGKCRLDRLVPLADVIGMQRTPQRSLMLTSSLCPSMHFPVLFQSAV